MVLSFATSQEVMIDQIRYVKEREDSFWGMQAQSSSGVIRGAFEVHCPSEMLKEFPEFQLEAINASQEFVEMARGKSPFESHKAKFWLYPIVEYRGLRVATLVMSSNGPYEQATTVSWRKSWGLWVSREEGAPWIF